MIVAVPTAPPGAVALMVTVPLLTAVAVVVGPAAGATVAMPSSLLTQAKLGCGTTGLPLPSRASAVNTCVAPNASNVTGEGVTTTSVIS